MIQYKKYIKDLNQIEIDGDIRELSWGGVGSQKKAHECSTGAALLQISTPSYLVTC